MSLEEATVAHFIVVIYGRNSISQLYLRFVQLITIYTVKFGMFLVVVVLARCLLKITFLTLNRCFEKKLFHLLLD